ncbi:MAG: hypothetical protein WCI40_03205 [Verrucomicrobiota bacterium]
MKILLALFHVTLCPDKAEGSIWPIIVAAFFAAAWLRWLGA